MSAFETMQLPPAPNIVAPDGMDVRILLGTPGGSMAHFELGPGQVTTAIGHRTVDEVWFFLSGAGELWRSKGGDSEVLAVEQGVCISILAGTHFQMRCASDAAVTVVSVTMPPWPGEGEAFVVDGAWAPTIGLGTQ